MVAAAVDNKGYSDYTFTETLDASGNKTSWVECRNFRNHTIQFTNPTQTAVKVRMEGSLDGTYFFGIDGSGNSTPDGSGNVTVTNPNATYAITAKNTPINYIRLALVSYSGGATAAGITPIKYRGG